MKSIPFYQDWTVKQGIKSCIICGKPGHITNSNPQDLRHMKKHTLEELTDKYVGKPGTPGRDRFDFELKTDVIGEIIRKARIEQHLTQAQLGVIIGVQKAQISKIENNAKDVRLSTILRTFEALKARVNLTVELASRQSLKIA